MFKSGIYVDSARGRHKDSSSINFSPKVLLEICVLQKWFTNHLKAYFESKRMILYSNIEKRWKIFADMEPWNLVPGHFWNEIRTFFRNQRFKDMNLKLCCGFVKNRFKTMRLSLHFYLKHHNMYPYNPSFSKFVYINCPDISKFQSQFPDNNDLFACLRHGAPKCPMGC